MTRDEEILKAARNYVSGVTLSSPSDVIHFEAGAKWSDKNPINLWHDASEEPQGDNYKILCVDDFDLFWVESRVNALWKLWKHNNWKEYAKVECVKMWAYIDDLLPKKFRKSEQEKGGER